MSLILSLSFWNSLKRKFIKAGTESQVQHSPDINIRPFFTYIIFFTTSKLFISLKMYP